MLSHRASHRTSVWVKNLETAADRVLPIDKNSLMQGLVYALILTLCIVIAAKLFDRFFEKTTTGSDDM